MNLSSGGRSPLWHVTQFSWEPVRGSAVALTWGNFGCCQAGGWGLHEPSPPLVKAGSGSDLRKRKYLDIFSSTCLGIDYIYYATLTKNSCCPTQSRDFKQVFLWESMVLITQISGQHLGAEETQGYMSALYQRHLVQQTRSISHGTVSTENISK